MRRLRIKGLVISSCFTCCAAAILMIGLAALGHRVVGGSPRAVQASNGAHDRLLPVIAAPVSGLISSKSLRVAERYRQFPLSFEPNRKQTNAEVKFLARGEGYILFLTDKEAVFSLGKAPHPASVFRMSLLGANAKPSFAAMEALPGKSNYLIGNKPENWHTDIPNYRKVAERNIYPGIDLVYYGTQRQLEYDFVVAPGASPSKIQIAFTGAKNIHTSADGDLILSVAGNDDIRLHRPIAYQNIGAEKKLVAANFVMKGKDRVEFGVGNYDASLPLIVDPILSYSTYLGGSNIDGGNSIAVAPDNTAFIAGGTFSTDFPTTHQLQPNHNGPDDFSRDAFVAKISADGSTLLYATYLGGKFEDVANGIAVDNFGNAYVTGSTLSFDFPSTPNSFNTACGGDGKCGATFNPQGDIVANAFVTKLNVAGSGLVYSGFLGNYASVLGNAIAVDANGNAYVTGQTGQNIPSSIPLPAIPAPPALPPPPPPTPPGFPNDNAISPPAFAIVPVNGVPASFEVGIPGTSNAFVTKISASGSSYLYSSYLGGSTEDVGYGITVDSNANAYITGLAYSADFPTVGALQSSNSGAGDAFLAKVNTTLSGATSLSYSTLLGGAGWDQGNGVSVDNSGNAYIAGVTSSVQGTLGFTPPVGGFQSNCSLDVFGACQGDAFVAKLNTNQTGAASLAYFTYLGGTKADAASGVAIDSLGNAYVTGTTVSNDFPIAGAAFQPTYGGGNADAFVAKVDPTGASLVYSSYLGGTNTELPSGIAVDTSGSAYVTGQTCSQDFPLSNPLQVVPGGNCDAYIAKVSILPGIALNPAGLVFTAQSLNTTSQSQTVTLTNGDNIQTISSVVIAGTNAGDFTIETNTCPIAPSTLSVGATCTISVSFSPSAIGVRKGSIQITDTAPGSPHVINLTGSTSTVTLSTARIDFGSQQVGIPSAPKPVTVTNSGTAPLTFSSIAASGDFSETDNCLKAPLQPNTNCVVQVVFTPSAAVGSLEMGTVTLTDNGSGSPQIILTTGTGVQEPQASLSTASLGFAGQPISVASAAQTVTLSNTGNAPLNIASIVATGDFSEINPCGALLAAGTNCTISVTFTPTAAGARNGTLTITDNSGSVPGSTQAVQLSGTGLAVPVVSLSPSTLTFAGQTIGTPSAAQSVTLTNSGSAPLTISNVTAGGDFAQLNNCPTSVAAGASCIINVTFTPTAAGNRFGTITITDNAASSPQTISLSGTGNATSQASISVASLGFTGQPIGATSAGQPVTLSNTGAAPLNISSILAAGDFAQSSTCGPVLSASASCTISVTFTPTAAAARNGALTITDDTGGVPGSVQTVQLSGIGQAIPVVSLSTSTLTFSGQAIGTTSAAQSVTLTNTGSAALIISNVAPTGDFAQLNNCPASVAAGASCIINVTFTPTAAGNRFGSVTITDNAANSPQTISLTGNGNASPQASLSLASLGFVGQPVSSISAAQTVTLTNTGDASLNIAGVVATGDFSQNSTCGLILAAGANCSISVTFTPTATGTRNGTLTITDNTGNVAGSTQTVLLSGVGQAVPVVSLSPTTLTFAGQAIGTTSASQAVTLTNNGSAALIISNVAASGDFAQVNNCATSVAAGTSCVINVTFTPTASGNRFGSVTIADNATDTTQTILLSGVGNPTPQASLSTASLGFANQSIGTPSVVQTVTLSNPGAASLSIAGIVATGDFSENNTCGALLSAGANCTISVTFTPAAAGNRTGTLTITDNSGNVAGSIQTVQLSGIGEAVPVISLSTNTLTFAGQAIGTTSAAQVITLTNTGSAALTISNVAPSGDFAQLDNCPTSIAAGASCTLNITFTPTASGNRFGSVTIADNATNSPQTILLSGVGNPTPQASLSSASLGFASQSIGTPSAAQTVTLSNPGAVSLSVANIVATGDFSQTNTCGAILSAAANCTISVTFTPTAAGNRIGALTITDNSGNVAGSTQTVLLSGTGQAVPVASLSTSSLTFLGQAIGATSAAQVVTLSNTGTAALTISNVTANGDFAQVNNCPASVAAGASCNIDITFTPTVSGNRFGSVTITDNAPNSPQTISLSGVGNPTPQAVVSSASLGFSAQPIGSPSPAQAVTLSNAGAASMSVTNIVATGDFTQTNTCGAILSAAANCTISVTFTPTVAGARNGTLTITDNSGNVAGSIQTVLLSGTGQAVPVVSLSTNTLTFPAQTPETTSAAQVVTLTNTGSAALIISNVAASGDFAEINNCPASVAAGTSCTLNITFTPTASGNRFGSVTITDNAINSPQLISISGTGTGASFSLGALTTSPAVPAGQQASFGISVSSPNGFAQPVQLSCIVPTTTISCSFSTTVVTPSATPTLAATMIVSTELRTMAPPSSRIKMDPSDFLRHFNATWLIWMVAILMVIAAAVVRRRPITAAFGCTVVLLLVSAACGAGGGTAGVPVGTPAGTYQITVTGTSGLVTSSTQVTLQVK